MSGVAAHGHTLSAASAGGKHRRRLAWALALVAAFFVVEATAGWLTGSLALLSDAGHLLTDVVGIGMALAAIQLALHSRERPHRSFGLYRLEIFAALANAVLLFGIAGWVLYEAFRRLAAPPEVAAGPMLVVALAGLAVNVGAFVLLRPGAAESLNIQGAYLEVLFDALNSVAVLCAAVVLLTTGWAYADPLFAAVIGVLVVPRAWRLAREALRVLAQVAPDHIPPAQVTGELARIDGVVDVHDVHLWTLTSGMEVATVHLVKRETADGHRILDEARDLLADRYGIEHATVQVEPESHEGCQQLTW